MHAYAFVRLLTCLYSVLVADMIGTECLIAYLPYVVRND